MAMSPQYSPHPPHPDNAIGDFYVERDSCVSCEAPHAEAPDLMGLPGSSARDCGCYFRRQPSTPEEVERACDAVMVSCVEAVRYAGNDRNILSKLYQRGAYSSCDVSPSDLEQVVIDHVRNTYRQAAASGVHWTFICDDLPTNSIIACCYGPGRPTLGVFVVDKSTKSVAIVVDDRQYRPHFDHFRHPRWRLSRWWPFARR